MRNVILTTMIFTVLAGSQVVRGQSVTPYPNSETGELSAEELRALCVAVPRACESGNSKRNQVFSFWGSGNGWTLKSFSFEEWRAACQAIGRLSLCSIPEKELQAWLKTKPGKLSWSFLWSRELCEKLAAGSVEIGMTRKMVLAAWGVPQSQYRSNSGYEQWVYGRMHRSFRAMGNYSGRFTYLSFENGVLKSFSESSHNR